jgi:serine/threonine protein kinase/HPt (histidine-containing phosphotransfer) domain-containing protein
LNRVVALKVLKPELSRSPEYVSRFQRELEVTARLSHPNIVAAYDAGQVAAGWYLAMEYVPGCDLERAVRSGGPLSVSHAVGCIVQAARALEYAHAQGITHRDVKPRNLLRDPTGTVKLSDLGLVKFDAATVQSPGCPPDLTATGDIAGSVEFMAPEQAINLKKSDHRSDIYSLGCTFYFLLTGKHVYPRGTLLEQIVAHREQPIPSLHAARSDVPESLDSIFRRMLVKNPTDRCQSMSEVIEAIEPYASDCRFVGPDTASVRPKQADLAAAQASSLHVHGRGETKLLQEISALIVEPSRMQSSLVRSHLNGLGIHRIELAQDGIHACRAMAESRPDLVISAMHLDDMTGVDLVGLMRANAQLRDVAFILISSETDRSQLEPIRQSGRVALVPKPFTMQQVAHAVTTVVQSSWDHATTLGAADLNSLKVLIVDDSAAMRRHIRLVLTSLGISDIQEGGDGRQAIELLERNHFDAVVSDYHMPRVDGRELVQYIRSHPRYRSIPVLMVTSEQDQSRLTELEHAGVSALCDKPFDPATVCQFLLKVQAQMAEPSSPAVPVDPVLGEFIEEGRQQLLAIESHLRLIVPQAVPAQGSSSIFRMLHTLKGSAGFLGFEKLVSLSRAGESVLKHLREGKLGISSETAVALRSLADAIRELLGSIERTGNESNRDYSPLVEQLSRLEKAPS